MYKKEIRHKPKPKSGCPTTDTRTAQTFKSITGIINNITYPFC
jgi:hypothetical protein